MATTLKNVRMALLAAFTSDDELAAWASDHFGAAGITGLTGRQIGSVREEEKPAVVVGSGAIGDIDEPAIGGASTEKHAEIPFWFAWDESDAEKAADQHDELNDILSRLVLRKSDLGGADAVTLAAAEPARTDLPVQIHEGAVRAQFTLSAAA